MIQLIEPSLKIITDPYLIQEFPSLIEEAGRTCYKSQDRITPDSADRFCRSLIRRGHTSVLEHCSITVRIVCDRATSLQIIRHRLTSPDGEQDVKEESFAISQESQRYVRYDGDLKMIAPLSLFGNEDNFYRWNAAVHYSFGCYMDLIRDGVRPEDARSVLPNCTATEIVMTANVREWRHIFKLRCDPHAQAQIRGLMTELRDELARLVPCLFDDLTVGSDDEKDTATGESDYK